MQSMVSSSSTAPLKRIPTLLYGTAWKKERTRDLVHRALRAGFRGIDTAAQPKHYQEDLVGAGIRDAIREGNVAREDLWIQTKFTPIRGQDPSRLPHDPNASLQEQIRTSIASSLRNLDTSTTNSDSTSSNGTYLDCLLLHSPLDDPEQTLLAWEEFSHHVPKTIRALGISNVSLPTLEHLHKRARCKPAVVQNSFHAGTAYDRLVRGFCRENGIVYQSFWTLTANPHLLDGHGVRYLASEAKVSEEVALYALVAFGLNIRVLNGTTNEARMREDLAGLDIVQKWREQNRREWQNVVSGFRGILETS